MTGAGPGVNPTQENLRASLHKNSSAVRFPDPSRTPFTQGGPETGTPGRVHGDWYGPARLRGPVALTGWESDRGRGMEGVQGLVWTQVSGPSETFLGPIEYNNISQLYRYHRNLITLDVTHGLSPYRRRG